MKLQSTPALYRDITITCMGHRTGSLFEHTAVADYVTIIYIPFSNRLTYLLALFYKTEIFNN